MVKKLFLIGLVIELAVGGLFLLGLLSPSAQAEGEDTTLAGLLPDIEKIYRTALTSPLQEVEKEIEDPEIAEFYHRLIQKYELDEP